MLEEFFTELPIAINILLIIVSLYIVTRASHYMVDGAVYIAREFRISPLVIGATVVAMGTSSSELAVNMVVVLGGGDTSTVVGNILGSNLINIGIELGVSAIIAGLILVPRGCREKDIPLYLAATGMVTALVIDGQISRAEAVPMLLMFILALSLIIQYARTEHKKSVLVVEVTEIEAISHPTAVQLTRGQAGLALFGGLVVLVLASRLLIFNTSSLAVALNIPQFIIGLVIIGPGTSLPEIASSIQAVRKGHPDLCLGTAFGSNLFNLLFGLGLPALIRPLVVSKMASQSFIFMNIINITLVVLLLVDLEWLGRAKSLNRVIGIYLVTTYVGYISYLIVVAAGGTLESWLKAALLVIAAAGLLLIGRKAVKVITTERLTAEERGVSKGKILCATRGGQASLPTHEKAIEIALDRGAELIFLYVFDQRAIQHVATPIVINVSSQMDHMRAFLRNTAQRQAGQAGVKARVLVRAGSLREQIQAIAKEERVDLVVMGNPSEKSSLFKREALRVLADEIEAETGIQVLALSDQEIET